MASRRASSRCKRLRCGEERLDVGAEHEGEEPIDIFVREVPPTQFKQAVNRIFWKSILDNTRGITPDNRVRRDILCYNSIRGNNSSIPDGDPRTNECAAPIQTSFPMINGPRDS